MTDRNIMRGWIALCEAQTGSYRLFHGTNAQIEAFRFDDLRHRTGTPGTLAFTTSLTTARVYGSKIYQALVTGTFGDYQNPDDVEKAFEWRWNEASRDQSRFKPDPDRLRRDITKGNYEMWENVSLWKDMGWDGAWCFEPRNIARPTDDEGRNLIVGRTASVELIGLMSNAPE